MKKLIATVFLLVFLFPCTAFAASHETESNDSLGSADPISFGTTMVGKLNDGDDQDWYKLVISKNGHFNLKYGADPSAKSGDAKLGWNVEMRDADRHLLRDYNETSVQTPEMALKPGTYYLCVRRDIYLPNCSYNLLLTFTEDNTWITDCYDDGEKFSNAKTIQPRKQYTGTIFNRDDFDVFKVNLKGKGKVNIRFKIDDSADLSNGYEAWTVKILDGKHNELFYKRGIDTSFTTDTVHYNGFVYVVVSRSDYAPTDCIYHITAINTPASTPKSSSSRTVTSKPVNKTRIAKAVNRKGRRIFVKWRRNKKASGYQVQFSKKRSFPKRVTRGKIIGRNTKTTYTRKLARGRWYVRVRCLKGKRHSSWSKVRTIRIKK